MLHEFITQNRGEIIARCRAKISSRPAPRPTDVELEHGVPLFLDQLTEALQRQLAPVADSDAISPSAAKHGHELLKRGFTVDQVVHDYGGVCQSITELAVETSAPITNSEFQCLNLCLDDAIAAAVTEYGRVRRDEDTERLGRFAHELRNMLSSATLAYDALKTGSVGIGGSTGAVLGRSLLSLQALIDRELAEVRLGAGVINKTSVIVNELLAHVEQVAGMDATARGVELLVVPCAADVTVYVDRPILESVLSNLLQNAFKFTHSTSQVVLRVQATDDHVLFDIEDACGGLPAGQAEELFRPYVQRGANKTGAGLGLAVCYRGAQANGGELRVLDRPGVGCVFTVDLPRERPLS